MLLKALPGPGEELAERGGKQEARAPSRKHTTLPETEGDRSRSQGNTDLADT